MSGTQYVWHLVALLVSDSVITTLAKVSELLQLLPLEATHLSAVLIGTAAHGV